AAALRSGRVLAPLRAAPLRCGLSGSRPWRPGLLAVGEAAGLTLPLIGEGVGKALESGLLAADLVRAFLEGRLPESELGPAYASEIQARWGRLHHGYRRGQRWLASPRVCDFFVRRARRGGYVRRQIEGTLAETTHLGTLFTPLGLLRSMFS
ncbi:geranylgeranyl reductase, partial [Dissulfurirhabdus thermomarina]|nr:geranylgeranyl reductase [Dissulfurirhabdus thermomarina]